MDLPEDWAGYVVAFLLQMYRWPAVAAAIQTLLALIPVFAVYVIIRNLLRKDRAWRWVSISLAVISLYVSVSLIVTLNDLPEIDEEIAKLEYMAEHRQWNEILEEVSVRDAVGDSDKRKYALLALSETGQLAEYAFLYGLSGPDDFVYPDDTWDLCHFNFNALFYKALDLHNCLIFQTYQSSSVAGLGFDVLRQRADAYIGMKNYELAMKYVEILGNSSFHGSWVEERLPVLREIRDAQPDYSHVEPKFIFHSFLSDMSALVERHPDNEKYAHFLLCAILAEREGIIFYEFFRTVAKTFYPDGKNIPERYQEALLVVSSMKPDALDGFEIDDDVMASFRDFTSLVTSGKTALAKRRYAETYWAYAINS